MVNIFDLDKKQVISSDISCATYFWKRIKKYHTLGLSVSKVVIDCVNSSKIEKLTFISLNIIFFENITKTMKCLSFYEDQ